MIYSNNARSLEKMKRNTEQHVANTDPEIFTELWMLVFEKMVDISSICCKSVL
jgi:hypothetical protein